METSDILKLFEIIISRGDPGELSHVLHFVPFCRDER